METEKTKTVAVATNGMIAGFNREQVELIKSNVAKGATDMELAFYLHTAKRVGLDPLTKQIHFVKRAGQMTVQTGIDGFRAIADRTEKLAGIDDPVYDSEESQHPNKASVTVYKMVDGQKMPFTASARWAEYAPTGSQAFMWTKMPYLMLGKCAEALALRKAFPNDLSGLYTTDEMAQANPAHETLAEYDNTPVPENAEVISTGDDLEQKEFFMPEDEKGKKNLIVALLIKKDPKLDIKSAKSIQLAAQDSTQLEWKPENFEAIINALRN